MGQNSIKNRGQYTMFENENERQKTEQVPIPLTRASRNFSDVKTRNEIFFHNWTSEIIPFIRFGKQMDGTDKRPDVWSRPLCTTVELLALKKSGFFTFSGSKFFF